MIELSSSSRYAHGRLCHFDLLSIQSCAKRVVGQFELDASENFPN